MSSPRAIGYGLATLVVLVLAGFDPAGWAPFGPVKWAVLTTLAFGLATLVAAGRSVTLHVGSAMAWTLFLSWGMVASLAALDPLHTWIGTPDRHLGLVAWLCFAVVFVVAQQAIDPQLSSDLAITVVKGVVVASLATGLYVLLELAGLPPVRLAIETGRAGGPFGTAAYLGAAATLLLPVSIGAAVDGLGSRLWRSLATAAAALAAVSAVAAQTRAAWVGLAVALVVVSPALLPWLRRRTWILVAIGLSVAVVVVATPTGSRIVAALRFDEGTTRGRIDEWQVGTRAFRSHAVTGTGFEGYRIAFPSHVDADYERRYTRVTMPDRVHNGALDVAVTTGLPGLALYLAGALWLVTRAIIATRDRRPVAVGIAAAVTGYIAQQQFLFPVTEVDPVFWALAGLLVAATAPRRTIRLPPGAWLVPLAVAVAALAAGGLDVAADRRAAHAAELSAAGSPALAAADAAVTLRPDSIRYRFVAAGIASSSGDAAGLSAAITRIEAALDVSPGDPLLGARHASLLLDLARVTGRPEDAATAAEQYRSATGSDPKNAAVRLGAGIAYLLDGDPTAAETAWLTSANLAPRSAAPLVNLAVLYVDMGRLDEARTTAEAVRAIDPDHPALEEIESRLGA